MDISDSGRHAPAHAGLLVVDPCLAPVTLADREVFRAAIASLREPLSDSSFAATLCWAAPLDLRWTLIEGHLCLFSAAEGDLSMMLPPMHLSPRFADRLGSVVAACFEIMDAANSGAAGVERSRIEYVSDEMLDRIRTHERISLSASPMPGDYVYRRDALVELAGGELKGKRKLRSKFLRENPVIETGRLCEADLPECEALLSLWRETADEKQEGVANEQAVGVDVLRERDERCTLRYLRAAIELGLPALTVRSQGKLVGFTIGELVGPGGRMGVVAVEKTHPDYPGTPQFIYSEFCRTELAQAEEINAGDDWGIATLRYTKTSYRPTRMLSKSMLTRQGSAETGAAEPATVRLLTHGRPASRAEEKAADPGASVRYATLEDVGAIMTIERESFSDTDDRFTLRQVRRLIRNPRARVVVGELDGRVVGWCVSLLRQHVRWRSGRVYSVAVLPGVSGRGIGRALLTWSLALLEAEGVSRVYLEVREANAAARTLYQSLGFEAVGVLPAYYGAGADGIRMRRVRGKI